MGCKHGQDHCALCAFETESRAQTAAPETAMGRLRAALHAAAEAAVEAGVDLEPWMQACWAAYVEHRPGLRQHLEDVHLANQLEELRNRGQVPKA